jgi:HEPN domain-containing protein
MAITERPNYDAVCFHAQQCVEKVMKAFLIHRGMLPPKVHDLTHLNRLMEEGNPEWFWPEEELRFLTCAGIEYWYPGESADYEEAAQAMDICERLFSAVEKGISR